MTSIAKWHLAMMKPTKTKNAAGLAAALFTISILFSDQQRRHFLHFLRIVDPDFDAFVYPDGLACRAALFLPYACLAVADSLVKHCNLLSCNRLVSNMCIAKSVPELRESSGEGA